MKPLCVPVTKPLLYEECSIIIKDLQRAKLDFGLQRQNDGITYVVWRQAVTGDTRSHNRKNNRGNVIKPNPDMASFTYRWENGNPVVV
jgi:hypothetical protein